jgi:hypothetical protein
MAPRPLSSEIVAAIEELCEGLDRFHTRQGRRVRLTRCLELADELIRDLRELGLTGSTAVPAEWQPRLDRFARGLPAPPHETAGFAGTPGAGAAVELRAGVEPARLLEQIFDVEEELLWLQLKDLRARV